jgi:hypothetical protein
MRSLEYLIQLYPNKTGKQLLAIQAKEKEAEEKEYQKRHKEVLEMIQDINTNGGFYKGRFGSDQRFYYNVTEARLEGDKVYANVESIVVFLGDGRSVVKAGDVSIEKKTKEWADLSTYGLDMYQRTTKQDYDEVMTYLLNLAKYWDDIKKV